MRSNQLSKWIRRLFRHTASYHKAFIVPLTIVSVHLLCTLRNFFEGRGLVGSGGRILVEILGFIWSKKGDETGR